MPDRTSQPPAGIGIRAAYAATARFLWNGADPGKNSLNGANTTSTIRGTNTAGADGFFQLFNTTAGSINFAITSTDLAATGYTLVVGFALPNASVAEQPMVAMPGSLRFECGTTSGGMRASLVHSGVAAAAQAFTGSISAFDTEMWTYVAVFTGTGGTPANQLRQYLRRGDGSIATTTTETLAPLSASGAVIEIGNSLGSPTSGDYVTALLATAVSDAEAIAVRDNAWRVFEETGGGGAPSFTTQPSAQTVTQPATASFAWASTGAADGFQVQRSTDGGSTWGSVPDGTGASGGAGSNLSGTYVTTATAVSTGNHRNGYLYRVQINPAGTPVNSNSALLTVNAPGVLGITLALTGENDAPVGVVTVPKVFAIRYSDNTLIHTFTSVTTNGSGQAVLAHASLTAVPHLFAPADIVGLLGGGKFYTPA